MTSYPIFMTTADPENKLQKTDQRENRFLYFVRSVNSLEESNVDLSFFRIYDDCSMYPKKLKYLLTKSRQYMVIDSHENLGTTLNTVHAFEECFNLVEWEQYKGLVNEEYIIFLQDDIIFSENWLEDGIKIFKQIDYDIEHKTGPYTEQGNYSHIKKVPFLCLYNRAGKSQKPYYLYPTGHPGGVAWIMKRKAWGDYRNHYSNMDDMMPETVPVNERTSHHYRHIIDHKLSDRFHRLGWDCAMVGKSLVQHIGDRSGIGNRDMRQHRSTSFVGKDYFDEAIKSLVKHGYKEHEAFELLKNIFLNKKKQED